MASVYEFAQSNPDDFLAQPIEVLAGFVLKELAERSKRDRQSLDGYCGVFLQNLGDDVGLAIAEAWAWLTLHGCLATHPGWTGGVCFVTRRGHELLKHPDLPLVVTEELHLRELLHPKIIEKSWSSFIRQGEERLAVLAGFIAVEVAVREATGQSNEVYGRELVKMAFRPDGGILVNTDETPSEKEAVFFLFTGAVGYCRNPAGHRDIPYSKGEAAEILMFASYLLRIVDSRRETRASSESQDAP